MTNEPVPNEIWESIGVLPNSRFNVEVPASMLNPPPLPQSSLPLSTIDQIFDEDLVKYFIGRMVQVSLEKRLRSRILSHFEVSRTFAFEAIDNYFTKSSYLISAINLQEIREEVTTQFNVVHGLIKRGINITGPSDLADFREIVTTCRNDTDLSQPPSPELLEMVSHINPVLFPQVMVFEDDAFDYILPSICHRVTTETDMKRNLDVRNSPATLHKSITLEVDFMYPVFGMDDIIHMFEGFKDIAGDFKLDAPTFFGEIDRVVYPDVIQINATTGEHFALDPTKLKFDGTPHSHPRMSMKLIFRQDIPAQP